MTGSGTDATHGLLLVASDDATRDLLAGDPAWTVTESTDPDAALDRLRGVDAVVIAHADRHDPVQLVERITDREPALPVFVVGPDDGSLAGACVAAGAAGYVTADQDVDVLRDRLRRHLPAPDDTHMPIEDLGPAEELRLKGRAIEEAPVGVTISDPDRDDNPLIFLNDAFEALTGYPKPETVGRNCRFLQGDDTDPDPVREMRDAIEDERPVTVELLNYRADGDPFWNRVDIAPIRDNDGRVTHYVGFQTDITKRVEAEHAAERERDRLAHLLDRVTGLLEDVQGDLIRATTRGDVEAAVCDRIAATDPYGFCWLGRYDPARGTVTPAAWAGDGDPPPDPLPVDADGDALEAAPVAAALDAGTVDVVEAPPTPTAERSPWLRGGDVAGLAAIPLVYRGTRYGVLVVTTTEPGALDDHERVVLEALGRAAATAINALERERVLVADEVVEVEFEIRDPALFLVDLSAEFDAHLAYEGSIHTEDGPIQLFFTTDLDPERVAARVEAYPEVERAAALASFGEDAVVEFTLAADSFVTALAGRGARIRHLDVDDGVAALTVELPVAVDVREVADRLRDRYPDTELVARRDRERRPQTKREFIEQLREDLTERQRVALQTAFMGGYYEWDRGTSGDELAAGMGIARSTYHQHLRAAERKLVAAVFEDEAVPN